jgi:hypothetical protein
MPDHRQGAGICARDEWLIQPHVSQTDAAGRRGASRNDRRSLPSCQDPSTINTETTMVFKETKGNKTVEACVMPAPGGMFKGYIRVTTKRGSHTIERSIGRGCGRPVKTEQEALELAEPEARRVLAL